MNHDVQSELSHKANKILDYHTRGHDLQSSIWRFRDLTQLFGNRVDYKYVNKDKAGSWNMA